LSKEKPPLPKKDSTSARRASGASFVTTAANGPALLRKRRKVGYQSSECPNLTD
jgi:hypothetical protein